MLLSVTFDLGDTSDDSDEEDASDEEDGDEDDEGGEDEGKKGATPPGNEKQEGKGGKKGKKGKGKGHVHGALYRTGPPGIRGHGGGACMACVAAA